jgi:S-adenosylmethionine hydrolase
MRIITFLSDFGTRDWFTAAVKGEIFEIAPDARVVDITHDIAPFDVRGAAFLLYAVYDNFPKGTIHLAVVDPGVGGSRRPIVVESAGHYFVGPDNGLFSYIYSSRSVVYEIKSRALASSTFHARDIFGPAAARLAMGHKVETLGRRFSGYTSFKIPRITKKGRNVKGEIVYIDNFGNCITNVPNQYRLKAIDVAHKTIAVKKSYSEGKPKELVVVKGSVGYYEIASNQGNASAILNANVGTRVEAHRVSL